MAVRQAMRQVPSPLAMSIHKWIDGRYSIPIERDIYNEFARRKYKPVTVYLAMCELYQAGYINGIVSH